ncbi:carboxypeptidase-like regulatory domain-containing protein [Bremerella sp. JC817]|uniref:carboxypeptidase-like regulatory domain-containing protein n=1 Tax=Bremerella sp. JC817 TaxID=3231756 RepID=UPI003459A9AD
MTNPAPLKFLFGLMIVAAICGCDPRPRPSYRGLELIPVSGTVTLDGQPLVDAIITFTDTETRKLSYAKTDSSGYYELHFDKRAMGIMAGEKVVEMSMDRKILGFNSDAEADGEVTQEGVKPAKLPPDAIPACYNRKSQLRVNVSGDRNEYNFDLKSDCSTTSPS